MFASAGQIGQVIVNLVTNAAKSTPAGRRGLITIRVGAGGPGMARIEVADNGAGIDPAVMKRIFDPLLHDPRDWVGHGAGPAHRHATTAHGGTITAASTPGRAPPSRWSCPQRTVTPPIDAPFSGDRKVPGRPTGDAWEESGKHPTCTA